MSDVAKTKALELAIQGGGDPGQVVARASAYHDFLTGGAPKNPTTATATGKGAGASKSTETTGAAKGAASGKNGAAGAATTAGAATGKPAGAGATKGNANPVPGDTKAPGGTNDYSTMVRVLTKVRDKVNKDECMKILKEDGGGAATVRDVKPALYDAVVEACNNVLSDEGGAVEDPTAQPERDEMGL